MRRSGNDARPPAIRRVFATSSRACPISPRRCAAFDGRERAFPQWSPALRWGRPTNPYFHGSCRLVHWPSRSRKDTSLRDCTAFLHGPTTFLHGARLSLASIGLFRRAESLSSALRPIIVNGVRLPRPDDQQTSGAIAFGRISEALCSAAASRHVHCALRNAPPLQGPRASATVTPCGSNGAFVWMWGAPVSPSLLRLATSRSVQRQMHAPARYRRDNAVRSRDLRSALVRAHQPLTRAPT
jgi:hypothetical protein